MSEQSPADPSVQKVSKEFAQMEKELTRQTSTLSLMREQMKSMLGMVAMFIITIVISLAIRPWYDVAELHAYGEAGSTQVRYVFLQLVMIFIFTAGVILLARYKKEWLIKYGILGVLGIALMYTTVPLAHMLVLDFETEDFNYNDTYDFDQQYLTGVGMDGFLTHELTGNSPNWSDSVSYWNEGSMISETPDWTYNQTRTPAGDSQIFRAVKSPNHITITNGAWISALDIQTGTLIESYSCHSENNGEFTLGTDCLLYTSPSPRDS